MALRFGNVLFEPLWRRECIANIQITIAESIGVGTRGDFYSRTGALRDMIQNHALQLLTMVAMEPPSRMVADAIRDEKLKVLRSLKAVQRRERRPRRRARPVPRRQRRRHGRSSASSTRRRCRRRARPRPSSRCAPRCRTGAGPACRSTCAPASAWPSATRRSSSTSGARRTRSFPAATRPTSWSSSCSPRTASSCTCSPPRAPGQAEALAPVSLDLDFDKAFAENRVGAYERLLLDVIAGRLNLFVRSDEQEEAWRWVEPMLEAWRATMRRRRARYAAGTWGPAAASALVARDGFAWAEEE